MTATDTIQWEARHVGGSRFADGSAIIRPAEMPWTDGPLDGLSFRLTHIDRATSMWTAIYKAAPDAKVPAHHNHGEVQYFIIDGSLVIGDVSLGLGDYYQTPGGTVPESVAGPSGATFFAMYTAGGLSAVDADGEPAGAFIDANRVYKLASANNGAQHLPAAPTR